MTTTDEGPRTKADYMRGMHEVTVLLIDHDQGEIVNKPCRAGAEDEQRQGSRRRPEGSSGSERSVAAKSDTF